VGALRRTAGAIDMGSFRDFVSGSGRPRDRRKGDGVEQPVPVERRTGDRRQGDRRESIDLTRPVYLERRATRDHRRGADQEEFERNAAAIAALAAMHPDPNPPSEGVARPTKTLEELEADFDALQRAMDRRLELLRDLPDEEFEAAQARAEDVVTAWAAKRKALEAEIVAERRRRTLG
jgi:hypothetical protein